jgi:glycosyltransferase involved in cell wall biosynthesis
VRVLIDARQSSEITGIGVYIHELLDAFGELDAGSIRALVWPRRAFSLRRAGVHVWPLPGGTNGPRWMPPADVVHGPNFIAPRHRSAKQVVTIHDLSFLHRPEDYPPGFAEDFETQLRRQTREAARIICVSEAVRRDVEATFDVGERVGVVPHGVRSEYFAAAQEDDQSVLRRHGLGAPFILSNGAIVPRKRVPLLLESFARLRTTTTEQLLLVLAGPDGGGWGADLDRVREWQRGHPDLADDVRVLDYVPFDDLVALYRSAAVCATATREEGFGLTVLQGMAAGTPVVAPPLAVFREFAHDVPWYADPLDAEAFAHALWSALHVDRDDPRIESGRDAARALTWRRAGEGTLEQYRMAVRG